VNFGIKLRVILLPLPVPVSDVKNHSRRVKEVARHLHDPRDEESKSKHEMGGASETGSNLREGLSGANSFTLDHHVRVVFLTYPYSLQSRNDHVHIAPSSNSLVQSLQTRNIRVRAAISLQTHTPARWPRGHDTRT
jgi:hypothetical protein